MNAIGPYDCLKLLKRYREKYVNCTDLNIYRELDRNNRFMIVIDGEVVESDSVADSISLVRTGNYINYVMPILQNVLSTTK